MHACYISPNIILQGRLGHVPPKVSILNSDNEFQLQCATKKRIHNPIPTHVYSCSKVLFLWGAVADGLQKSVVVFM